MKVLVSKMKDYIAMSVETLNKKNIFDDQIRWEFLTFEIRKLPIHYSVSKNRESKGENFRK